jgi:hypothetical protein
MICHREKPVADTTVAAKGEEDSAILPLREDDVDSLALAPEQP